MRRSQLNLYGHVTFMSLIANPKSSAEVIKDKISKIMNII